MSVTKVTGMMQTSTKGGDISSASPTVIDTDGDYFDVTGTTNFAAFTVTAGRRFTVQFDGALTMTHHASTLDLPGAANITTAAGDVAEFFATGTNTVQCVNYTKADGTAVVAAAGGAWTYISTVTAAGASTVSFSAIATSTYDVFACFFSNVYPSADNDLLLRMEEAGGPSVDSGSNYYGFTSGGNNNAATLVGLGQAGLTSWKLTATTIDGASTGTTDGVIYFSQMQKTSKRPAVWGTMKYTGNGTEMGVMTFGGSNAGADSDGYSGFQFLPGGGTFTGTFRLYGLAKS